MPPCRNATSSSGVSIRAVTVNCVRRAVGARRDHPDVASRLQAIGHTEQAEFLGAGQLQ